MIGIPLITHLIVTVLVPHVVDDEVCPIHSWLQLGEEVLLRLLRACWGPACRHESGAGVTPIHAHCPHRGQAPRLPELTGCGEAPGQPMALRLLLKHEVTAGLKREILLGLGDVSQGAAPPDGGPEDRVILCWVGHVQELGQDLQEELEQSRGHKIGHFTNVE